MKAWVLHGVNDMKLEKMDSPVPGAGEVLIAVRDSGICGSDIQRVYRTGAHIHPIIIGHEFSGTVVELGEGVDTYFECVGRNETFAQAVEYTAPAGNVVLTWNPSFTHCRKDDWHYVIERLIQKQIVSAGLISHRFPLEKLAQGLDIMHGKSEEYVKIMGVMD